MMGAALWIAGLLGQWCLGIAAAQALLGRRAADSPGAGRINAEIAGLGLVLGIGGTAWCLFLWSLLGGQLGRPISAGLTIVGLAYGLRLVWPIVAGRVRAADDSLPDAETRNDRSLAKVCQILLVFMSLTAIGQALLTPQRLWDERATFGMRAAVLFEDRTVWSPDLLDPDFVIYHPRYPLLLPLAEQHLYALLGHVDDRWSKIIFPLLFIGMCLCFAGVLSRSRSPGGAWLWAVILATVPALMPHDYGFLCGQADAPMACFHGLSILYLWDFWNARAEPTDAIPPVRSAAIAGLLAALAAFTKDEGLAFLIIDSGVLLGLAVFSSWPRQPQASPNGEPHFPASRRSPWLVAGIFPGMSLAILGPWFFYRTHLPLTTEMNYFGRFASLQLSEQVEPILWMFRHFAERMLLDPWEWGWQWWLMLAAAALAPRRIVRFGSALLLGDIAGGLLGLMTAGLLAPVTLHEHIGGSSDRFLMQLAPLAILFAAGQLTSPQESGSGIVK
ncbi:MAG: hypothetical protein U0872_15785 [Planctomycetaceae bacterium]